jgi:hypothetical protein
MKLEFKDYLKEMAIAQFGRVKGKHINDIDIGYAGWMLNNIKDGASNFSFLADDGSGKLSKKQIEDGINIILSGKKVAPTSVGKPVTALGAATTTPEPPKSLEPQKQAKDPSEYMIPEDKISEYQKSIEETFSKTNQHLAINALAGTGKTTILKHLAAKFSGGKKWLYLVFNKKNAQEATSGDKAFPPNVETMTSHKFLARVLNATRRDRPEVLPKSGVGGQASSDEGQDFGNKITKILDHHWFFNLANGMQKSPSFPGRGLGYNYQFIRFNKKKNVEEVAFVVKSKINRLVGLAKNFAINPSDPSAEQKIEEIMRKYDIDGTLSLKNKGDDDEPMVGEPNFTKQFVLLSLEILKATAPHGTVGDSNLDTAQDFDDIIWWPTLHPDKMVWPNKSNFEVALVDEVQDFNEAQKVMLENLAKNGIRIIIVGDPRQAIYRFRGADAKGFSNIEALLGSSSRGVSSHELPVNYRSGKKIIDFVNQKTHVKNLKSGRDHEGEVNPDATYEGVMSDIDNEWKKGSLEQETAFIARNNAPLLKAALHLLKNHIPFTIVGKDFSTEVLNFIYRIVGNDKIAIGKFNVGKFPVEDFDQTMRSYVIAKEDKYENKKDKEKYLDELNQLYSSISSLLEYVRQNGYKNPLTKSDIHTVGDLCSYIAQIFKGLDPDASDKDASAYDRIDKKKNVILTTAHKSKGLEFERVNILDDEQFPAGDSYDPDDEEEEQEHNAKYVAYTRATHALNITSGEEDKGKKKGGRKRLSHPDG